MTSDGSLNVLDERVALTLNVGAETSDAELSLVAAAFEGFDVKVEKNAYRLSETALPLLVSFGVGVLSSAAWDLLKTALLKLRSDRSTRRITRKVVTEVQSRRQFVMSNNLFLIRESTDERTCETFEEWFEELRRD